MEKYLFHLQEKRNGTERLGAVVIFQSVLFRSVLNNDIETQREFFSLFHYRSRTVPEPFNSTVPRQKKKTRTNKNIVVADVQCLGCQMVYFHTKICSFGLF